MTNPDHQGSSEPTNIHTQDFLGPMDGKNTLVARISTEEISPGNFQLSLDTVVHKGKFIFDPDSDLIRFGLKRVHRDVIERSGETWRAVNGLFLEVDQITGIRESDYDALFKRPRQSKTNYPGVNPDNYTKSLFYKDPQQELLRLSNLSIEADVRPLNTEYLKELIHELNLHGGSLSNLDELEGAFLLTLQTVGRYSTNQSDWQVKSVREAWIVKPPSREIAGEVPIFVFAGNNTKTKKSTLEQDQENLGRLLAHALEEKSLRHAYNAGLPGVSNKR